MRSSIVPAALAVLMLTATGAWAHGGEDHSHEAAPAALPLGSDSSRRLPDGSLFVPKPVQRQIGLRTLLARSEALAASVELNGTVIAAPGTSGRVQAPFAGSVHPGPKGMPVPGRRVAQGEVLAWLRPVASAIERGNQQAQLAELDAQLAISAGRVKRFEQLEGAVPQKEIEAARIEHAALQRRRTFVSASIDQAEPLRAPVGGVLSASGHLTAGQIVDAREVLFEIIDPTRLAVEALAYDAGLATNVASASAQLEGRGAIDLQFIGGGRQLREQALPLLFGVSGSTAGLVVGQPVKVVASTSRTLQGIAVPREALTKVGSGETVVWVHTDPERFAERPVRTQALDAGRVAVTSGLQAGERVVIEGAHLLTQVR